MSEDKIYIRFAEDEDCRDILNWRNDPESVKFSLSGKVDSVSHIAWFKHKIKDINCNLFIIINSSSQKIGTVRFDKNKKRALISINLNPTFRGKGLGKASLFLALKHYFNNFDVNTIIADIKCTNEASLHIFQQTGFKKVLNKNGVSTFELNKNEFNKIWN